MSAPSRANQFVCPNDRQLALRAKLRAGWSAARSSPPLSAPERDAIAAVVRRAERLDELEARRVGRLVARLEGMRRAARGPAARACALCGEAARLLAPLRACAACRQRACPKCLLLLGAAAPSARARAAPAAPGAEPLPTHRGRSGGSRAPGSGELVCLVCAETREMWKKSGAWFYRALPAYVLPDARAAARRRAPAPQDGGGGGGGSTSSGSGRSDSEPGSPPAGAGAGGGAARERVSRQPSNSDSRKSFSLGSQHELSREWSETDILSHGVSALSLQRGDGAAPLRRAGSRGSAFSLRAAPTAPAPAPPASAAPDAGRGSLELRLAYDGATSSLAAGVLRARALPPMDLAGLADPFCRLQVLPVEGTYTNRLRTKTVHKTRNPEFNETVHFFGITQSDLASKSLEVVVLDDDRYGCDEMGWAAVALRECARAPATLRLALLAPPAPAAGPAPRAPRLLLALCYSTKRRALAVTLCRAADLPPRDSNGYSDPFVKLHLSPDPHHRKHKSSVRWRSLAPVWDEEFLFDTRPTELARQALTLSVWDKDYGKRNDFLGCLELGAASKGARLKHWMDCIKFPDHRHDQWHALTDTQHL